VKVSHTSVAMAVYGPVDWVIESTVSEPTGPVILEEAGDLLDADGPAAEVPCAEVVLGTVWAVSELECSKKRPRWKLEGPGLRSIHQMTLRSLSGWA